MTKIPCHRCLAADPAEPLDFMQREYPGIRGCLQLHIPEVHRWRAALRSTQEIGWGCPGFTTLEMVNDAYLTLKAVLRA